jgi:hypothetical protein
MKLDAYTVNRIRAMCDGGLAVTLYDRARRRIAAAETSWKQDPVYSSLAGRTTAT